MTGYRLGENVIDLYCEKRLNTCERPNITIKCTVQVRLRVVWEKGEFEMEGTVSDER